MLRIKQIKLKTTATSKKCLKRGLKGKFKELKGKIFRKLKEKIVGSFSLSGNRRHKIEEINKKNSCKRGEIDGKNPGKRLKIKGKLKMVQRKNG